MSDLKGKALQAASEVVKSSIEGLDPKVIAQETAKILTSKEKLPTYQEALGEDPEAEDDRKVIRALGDMADLDRMGEEEKAKLVWEEMRAGLGWKKGKFWGFADKMGEWMLGKAIGWGILPVSMVTAAMAKRKLREEANKLKGRIPETTAETSGGVEELEQGLQKAGAKAVQVMEEGPERLRQSFNALRDQANLTLEEYKQVAEDFHVTGAAKSIGEITNNLGKLTYDTLSENGKKAIAGFLDAPKAENATEVLAILVTELKDLKHLKVISELAAWRIKDPNEKARFITREGFSSLRTNLKAKGISEQDLRTKGVEALLVEIENADYGKVPAEKWSTLKNLIESFGTGIALQNDSGFYHCVDYTAGFENVLVGFAAVKPASEIKGLAPVYFGQVGVLELRSKINEGAAAFFDPLKKVFGNRSVKSRSALERMEEGMKSGKYQFADLVLHPKTSEMGNFLASLREDAQAGNVILGIGQGTLAVGASGGWYTFKTVWNDAVFGSIGAGLGQLWENGDLKAAGRAGTAEYLKAVAPFMVFFAGTNVLKKLHNPDEVLDPSTMGNVVMGAAAGAYLPYRVVRVTSEAGYIGTRGALRTFNAKSFGDLGELSNLRLRYFTNQDYVARFAPKSLRRILRGDFLNAPNITRLENLAQDMRKLAYLEEMQKHVRVKRLSGRFVDTYLPGYHSQIKKLADHVEEGIYSYVKNNFSAPLSHHSVGKVREELLKRFVVNEGRVWLGGDFMAKLQTELDVMVLREGRSLTRVLGESLALSDELEELEALRSAGRATRTNLARINVLRAQQSASSEIGRLSGAFEAEMKGAKDVGKLKRLMADLQKHEDLVLAKVSSNVDTLSWAADDFAAARQAMGEAAHANLQAGEVVQARAARVKTLLSIDASFGPEAGRIMDATELAAKDYRGRMTKFTAKLTKEYTLLKKAARTAGEGSEFVHAYQRLMQGTTGGNPMTRLFRSTGGRLKLGVIFASAMAGVMGTMEAMKDDGDPTKRDIFAFLKEEGPELLKVIPLMTPLWGTWISFQQAWTGQEYWNGGQLSTGERVGNVGWTLVNGISDALTVIGLGTSWTGVGAAGAGVGISAKIASVALRAGIAAPRAAKIGIKLAEWLMKLGPQRLMAIIEEYKAAKAAGSLALKTVAVARAAHNVGLPLMLGAEAGRLVYSFMDDDQGIEVTGDALADLGAGITPYPTEAAIEHQPKVG